MGFRYRRRLDKIIDHIWYIYDTDHSGYLEVNELEIMLSDVFVQNHKKFTKEQMAIILSMLDENGDGRVEKEELKEILLR